EMTDISDARVKHREPFRPFAPAVLLEHASEFFHLDQPDPFMTLAPRVRAEKAHLIPAAVHVDGTGRIQTVQRSANPRYYGVIEAFARLTGVPVLQIGRASCRERVEAAVGVGAVDTEEA